MKKTIIYNARCVDPETDYDAHGGVVIVDGLIQDIFTAKERPDSEDKDTVFIDAKGCVLCPSLCDIFVGVGEPGGHHKENFQSLNRAALYGGITAVMIDPDTAPVLDTPATVDYALSHAVKHADIDVYVAAALTKNLSGQDMTEMGLLSDVGVSCLTDGDKSLPNSLILYRALSYSLAENMVIATYADDPLLSDDGIAHDGFVSSLYGLKPVPAVSEQIGLMRDIELAKATGAKLHVRGISSAASLPIIARAKDEGVDLTVSVSAQHIALNENDIIPYKSFLKMRPPLRSEDDRAALSEAVCNGLIDIVISQHRPRHADTKRLPYQEADFGCSAIETLLSIILELYHNGKASLVEVLKRVTIAPRKRFGLSGGLLQIGASADLIVVDIDRGYKLERHLMRSNSTNTPYEGRLLQGICQQVFKAGEVIYES
ncbi:MAG: amidohydrolase family protein [Pseudomonadota bacterium]